MEDVYGGVAALNECHGERMAILVTGQFLIPAAGKCCNRVIRLMIAQGFNGNVSMVL